MKYIKVQNHTTMLEVDDEDFERLNKFLWYDKTRHIGRIYYLNGITMNVSIQNEVMQNYTDLFDHKDRNYFNNKKENLRSSDLSLNSANRAKKSGCASKYKGVTFKKSSGRWAAAIKFWGRSKHIGYYDTEEEAAKAWDAKAKIVFGDHATLNFPS